MATQSDLPYGTVPAELLLSSPSGSLDLTQWSILLSDENLATIAAHQHQFSTLLLTLNLSGSEKVTDAGIKALSSCLSELETLHLDNAYQISSAGLSLIATNCKHLKHLSLAGCLKIDGVGFAVIGQGCRLLQKLNLSGCRQVKPWSFMKIFESCKQIEDLDLSYCENITDDEIKMLSESGSLRRINLRECKLVSDVGLTFLSQGCPNLLEINLKRSEMPFRVTDVALLQLAQGCQSIVSINLHGCEMITDTGLSWIASWLKDLRHLDLSRCNKVTNSGMRLLSEGCKNLKSIVLLNVKRVGDVGIRYLATECNHLERLNASGLSMLSDGVDRTFALEGLQSLSKSAASTSLKHLNLHGCPQICNLSLVAIASFGSLEYLDLSGCNKLTIAGATHIGKRCKRLTFLSLASCGDCVSNALFEAIILRLSLLKLVDLSFCRKISDRSLKALAKCSNLQHLGLSGCTGVTDQSILFLCEGTFTSPGLRNLLLAGCTKVTDTALSWIADGLKIADDGTLSLECLSVKGTRITLSALKGLRDVFPNSTLRCNDSYLGAWPLSRVDDRKAIKHYHVRACAAATIQAVIRSRREKDTLQRAREARAKKKVAIRIGALFRGGKAREHFKKLKIARKRKQANAMKLQCVFRCYSSKKALERLYKEKYDRLKPHACRTIQRHYRGVLGRRKANKAKQVAMLEAQRRLQAAVRLQAWSRMMIGRSVKAALKAKFLRREAVRLRSTVIIQSIWRRYLAKCTLVKLRTAFMKENQRKLAAVSRLYAACRRFLFKKALNTRLAKSRERIRCATAIQRWYRQVKEDIRLRIIAEREALVLRIKAAVLIQRNLRKRAA
ncbi:hypothetical protein ACHAWC_002336, partial [Mediolabrus comicus]